MMKRAVVMILLTLVANAVAQHVRVTLQVIEAPHTTLSKWMGTERLAGHELHDRAMKLTETGEADIADTILLIARSGEKATVESYAEMISPSIFEGVVVCGLAAPFVPEVAKPEPVEKKTPEHRYRRAFDMAFDSFETRNVGTTLEIEPMIVDGGLVDLRLRLVAEKRTGLTTWTDFSDQWGDASIRTPKYETQSMSGALSLAPGTFELFNMFTPTSAAAPAAAMRRLVFVRCEVVPIGR